MRLLPIILAFVLWNCKEISFKEPQPLRKKNLNTIPEILQGKYQTIEDDGTLSKDTVVIDATGYHFGFYDLEERKKTPKERFDVGILGDSLVLRSYKGYYFLNFNEKPEWMVRVLKPEKNGDLIFMSPDLKDFDFDDYLKKISAEVSVDSFEVNGEMLYQINPNPKKLIELIEKGFFSKSVLKKVKR